MVDKRYFYPWWLPFLMFCSSVNAAVPAPVDTKDPNHPFVRYLASQWSQVQVAAQQGDVATYKRMRTKEIIEDMESDLENLGKADGFGGLLKQLSRRPDLHEYEFQFCESTVTAARLSYRKIVSDKVEYFIALFLYEDGDWKVGEAGRFISPAKDAETTLRRGHKVLPLP